MREENNFNPAHLQNQTFNSFNKMEIKFYLQKVLQKKMLGTGYIKKYILTLNQILLL